MACRPFEHPARAERAFASSRLTPIEGRMVLGRAGDLAAGAPLAGAGCETACKARELARARET